MFSKTEVKTKQHKQERKRQQVEEERKIIESLFKENKKIEVNPIINDDSNQQPFIIDSNGCWFESIINGLIINKDIKLLAALEHTEIIIYIKIDKKQMPVLIYHDYSEYLRHFIKT